MGKMNLKNRSYNEKSELSKKRASEWVVNQEQSSMKPSIKEFTQIDGNTTSYSINGIKANARIRLEQDADQVLKNLKLKILGQPNDDVLLTTDKRVKHYKANENCIILKDGLLFRKTTEKRVVSKTTKISYQSSILMKYSVVSIENFGNILELPKQKLLSEKSNITQIWLN